MSPAKAVYIDVILRVRTCIGNVNNRGVVVKLIIIYLFLCFFFSWFSCTANRLQQRNSINRVGISSVGNRARQTAVARAVADHGAAAAIWRQNHRRAIKTRILQS